MKLSSIKVAADKVEGGDWIENIPEMEDLRLRVRGIGNAKYRRLQNTLADAVPRSKRKGGRIDPDEMDRITSTCLLETILIDWSGLEDESGEALPYSRDLAKTFLTDPNYRKFRDSVIWAASQVGEDEVEADKVDEGN